MAICQFAISQNWWIGQFYHSLIKVLRIAQLLAKADTFVSVSFVSQILEKKSEPRVLKFVTCKDTYPLCFWCWCTKHINFIAICGFLDAETQKKRIIGKKKFCFRNLNCPSINLAFIRNGNFMSHFINLKHIICIKTVSS